MLGKSLQKYNFNSENVNFFQRFFLSVMHLHL